MCEVQLAEDHFLPFLPLAKSPIIPKDVWMIKIKVRVFLIKKWIAM
jgi:hypothetical protein